MTTWRRRKRITFVTYSFREGIGGIETCSRLIARVLARNAPTLGYDCELIATRETDSEIVEGVQTKPTGGSRTALVRSLMATTTGSRVIFGHVNLSRTCLVVPWLRPLATVLYGIEVWNSPGWMHRMATARAEHLVAISEFTRERAAHQWKGYGRADVCWLGTQEDTAADMLAPAGRRPPIVLMVGRVVPGRDKGHRAVLDSWPRVKAQVPQAQLKIAGDGPDLQTIKNLAAGMDGVSCLGRVPQDQLDDLWRLARVLALPSSGEGFGLVYIDAMRRGIPVIVSDRDAGREVVGGDGAGISVQCSDSDGLADALVLLLKAEEDYKNRAEVAHQRWQQLFSFGAFEARFMRLLELWLAPESNADFPSCSRDAPPTNL